LPSRWLFPCKIMLFLHVDAVNRPYSDHCDNQFSVRPAPARYTYYQLPPYRSHLKVDSLHGDLPHSC
jgi:hypothetical protein